MQKSSRTLLGHTLALVTTLVWGSTFISSKVLLQILTPAQIISARFLIAYAVLWALRPKWEKTTFKDEARIFVLGLLGCTLYFLAENNALKFTLAANVSIIIASAPILTAILAHFFTGEKKLGKNTFLGFLLAFFGVTLVVFNGAVVLKLNPVGDLLSLCAALCWAVYSVRITPLLGKIHPIALTRKMMLYGFMTTLPVLLLEGAPLPVSTMFSGKYPFNLLFLGMIGSGVCYVTWSMAMARIGIVLANNYIYINPFVTLVTAALFLNEPISAMGFVGAVLIIGGVAVSSASPKKAQKVSPAPSEG
ncbi:MAG: DMT family transporter [Christensenellales bacterium]|jgi:drug/metabolite transporter (DMT)-like permease